MAVLTASQIANTGVSITGNDVAAASGGDSFPNDGNTLLAVTNGSGSSMTLTITTVATADGGLAIADRAVVVPAGETMLIGPFKPATYNDANGRVGVTYSDETSVTVLPLRQGK